MDTKPTLHVEVRLKGPNEGFVRTDLICEEVGEWLVTKFVSLRINQDLAPYEGLSHQSVMDSINVVDYTGMKEDQVSFHRLKDVQLDVQAYQLREGEFEKKGDMAASDQGDDIPQARVIALPNSSLDGLWESLIFETCLSARLLRFLTRVMTITGNFANTGGLNLRTFNWNRLLLLYGPPGTGKTTLCRALAHKLTIRLGRYYTQGKLIEINSHSLLSKYFSESSKLVAKLFVDIEAIAEDEETLICVLIDEVESLSGTREKSARGMECSDALRATNQLLTGLDRLRQRSNVVIFCTSNLLDAIDPAFMDRVDVKQLVPEPGMKARYEILRSCLNELILCGIISRCKQDVAQHPSSTEVEPQTIHWSEANLIPAYEVASLHLIHQPTSPGFKVFQIAERCLGLSGRTLRRLPLLAVTLHSFDIPCILAEALSALSLAVEDELSLRILHITSPFT